MQQVKTSIELRAAIVALERVQQQEVESLKEAFHAAYQEIQPINIIKSTVKKAMNSRDLKDDLLNATLGLGVGYASKSLFEGKTHSPARKLLGTALMFSVSSVVAKHSEFIKAIGESVMDLFGPSPKEEETVEQKVSEESFSAE